MRGLFPFNYVEIREPQVQDVTDSQNGSASPGVNPNKDKSKENNGRPSTPNSRNSPTIEFPQTPTRDFGPPSFLFLFPIFPYSSVLIFSFFFFLYLLLFFV